MKRKSKLKTEPHIKKHIGIVSIFTSIAFIAFGILLLAAPDLSGSIFAAGIAIIMVLVGLHYIISYFVSESAAAFARNDFSLGLTLLTGGIVLFALPVIPGEIMPYVWSSTLIIGGFAKLQTALDMLRLSAAGWWHFLIGAAISIMVGTIAFFSPFESELILLRFLGGGLVAEGLMDGYCCYAAARLRRALK